MIHVHLPANLFYPELPGGSNQYYRYGPFLRERGVRLHVHTARKPHHEEAQTEVRGICIHRYELPPDLSLLEELIALTGRAIERIHDRREPALLHPLGTTAASRQSLAQLWNARRAGIPSCFHFMNVPVRERHRFPGAVKERLALLALLSPYAKLLMCSHVMGRAFQDIAGISDRRIEPIPNGIDTSVFSPVDDAAKRSLREQLGWPAHAPIVLYVGSIIPRKGVEILIDAWEILSRRLPEARLVIVGSGRPRPTVRDASARSENERYTQSIGDRVDALTHPESILFVPEIDRIEDVYRAADVFAFASRREGLPSVLLEAMACGLPCVTAPFIGLPADGEEYGTAGEHFVRSSHDPDILAADLRSLLEQEEQRRAMGTAAATWVAATQEMGKATDRLAEVYGEMVNSA